MRRPCSSSSSSSSMPKDEVELWRSQEMQLVQVRGGLPGAWALLMDGWGGACKHMREHARGQAPTRAAPNPRPPAQLMIPAESAHHTVAALGDVGLLQFKDLNTDKSAFQRTYASQVR